MNIFNDIINAIKYNLGNLFKNKEAVASPIPTQTPTPTPTPDIVGAILKGFKEYGGDNLPVATLAATFKDAAYKNNLNPYLLPSVSILETSGGRNQTFENNPLNWGAKEPTFKPQSPEETIYKAASGIGTGRAFPYYEKYRQTGNLEDFASHYAPPGENNTKQYVENLKKLIKMFKKYER